MEVYVAIDTKYEDLCVGLIVEPEILGVYASPELAEQENDIDGSSTFVIGPFTVVEKPLFSTSS